MRRVLALLSVLSVSACGGGGGSSAAPPIQSLTPAPSTPTPVAAAPATLPSSASLLVSQSGGTVTLGAGGISATFTFPATASGVTLQLFATTSAPQSLPQIQGAFRRPQTATGTLYLQVTASQNVAGGMPAITSNAQISGVATFGPGATSWNYAGYTASASNTFVSSGAFVLAPAQSYYFALFTGTPTSTPSPGPSNSPAPGVSPTATPSPPATSTPTPTAQAHTATPTPIPASGAGLLPITYAPNGGWGPYAVANALQFPVQNGYTGAGLSIAIVGDYPASLSDLRAYLLQFGIQATGTFAVENVGAGSPMTDQAGFEEATLDVETAAGLAPGANIIFYSMPDLSGSSFLSAYNQIISDGKARVVSISFGGCEVASDLTTFDPIFKQGAAQGIAFVAASGDLGDRCAGSTSGVSRPASDPNVIAVGGTETSNAINSTRAWNDTLGASGQQATGGGISSIFPLPSYQAGLGASSTFRNVPDIAMPAVYEAVYFQGQWLKILGTSWSAPQAAAMIAEIYEYCNALSGLTPPSSLFYTPFAAKQYTAFLDVVSGTNQFGGDSVFFSGRPGFDNVGGIGIPLGMPVAQTLCPNRSPGSLARGALGAVGHERPAKAEATVLRTVPDLRDSRVLGPRGDASPTDVALVLRATETIARDEQIVLSSLREAGFAIVATYRNHLVIQARGPASLVARYFQTTLEDVAQGSHGVRFANAAPLTLPAPIAPYVQGAIADNLISAYPLSHSHRRPFR